MAKLIYTAIASLDGHIEVVDELQLLLVPVAVGAGKPALQVKSASR